MTTTLKTSHGIALLMACLLLSFIFITQAAKQFDVANTVLSTIQPRTQLAAVSDFNSNLVAHYTFDDTANDSAGSNNGTISGGATYTDGKIGRAISFDGVDDYVKVNQNASINDLGYLTYSAWIYPKSVGVSNVSSLIVKGAGRMNLRMVWGNQANLVVYCSSATLNAVSPASIQLNKWSHVVVTWNGQCGANAEVTFAIDNSITTRTNLGAGSLPQGETNELNIGGPGSFDGLIDDVRVYNRVLAPFEITELYNLNISEGGVIGGGNVMSDTITSQSVNQTPTINTGTDQIMTSTLPQSPQTLTNTYWVSPSGTANNWSVCKNDSDPGGSTNNYCSVSQMNSNIKAGETAYLKGGAYRYSSQYVYAVNPIKSGTNANWIRVKNAPGEIPEFIGTYGTRMWGLVLEAVSYIQIDGIIFSDFSDSAFIADFAHHIEVKNSTFRNITSPYRGGGFGIYEACRGGNAYNCPASNIWVHHNTFYKLAAGGGCNANEISEGGDAIRIGYLSLLSGVTGNNSHITVEDNYMAYGGHMVMDSYSIESVFRNNIAHNEPWYPADNGTCGVAYEPIYSNSTYNGLYSHRVWQFTDTFSRKYSHNLIENNRLGYGGVNPNNDGASSLVLASPGNIVRYNSTYGSMHVSMKTKYGANYGWQASGGINNRVYSNTLYKNGYGYPYFQNCVNTKNSTCPKALQGFRWYAPADNPGNILVNNIVYGSYGAVERGLDDIQDNSSGSLAYNNYCTNADTKCTGNGDPLFVNPDLTRTTSRILPDLNLRPSSPARDGGTHLTTIATVVDQTHIILTDPYFFQDGTWGADMTRGITLFPDWIAIGNLNNAVQIKSVNYLTGATVLVFSPSSTINSGDKVWLFKDSSGRQVLYGSAPDIGAYEYIGGGTVAPTCTAFTYSTWETCSNNQQTRTVTSSLPGGCIGGAPVITQTCTSLNNPTSVPADFNHDGRVNALDLLILTSHWNQNNPTYDLNADGIVNSLDYVVMVKSWRW